MWYFIKSKRVYSKNRPIGHFNQNWIYCSGQLEKFAFLGVITKGLVVFMKRLGGQLIPTELVEFNQTFSSVLFGGKRTKKSSALSFNSQGTFVWDTPNKTDRKKKTLRIDEGGALWYKWQLGLFTCRGAYVIQTIFNEWTLVKGCMHDGRPQCRKALGWIIYHRMVVWEVPNTKKPPENQLLSDVHLSFTKWFEFVCLFKNSICIAFNHARRAVTVWICISTSIHSKPVGELTSFHIIQKVDKRLLKKPSVGEMHGTPFM